MLDKRPDSSTSIHFDRLHRIISRSPRINHRQFIKTFSCPTRSSKLRSSNADTPSNRLFATTSVAICGLSFPHRLLLAHRFYSHITRLYAFIFFAGCRRHRRTPKTPVYPFSNLPINVRSSASSHDLVRPNFVPCPLSQFGFTPSWRSSTVFTILTLLRIPLFRSARMPLKPPQL